MSHFQVIADLAGGWLRGHTNEVSLDQKKSFRDAIKFRGGNWWHDWLIIHSGDLLEGDDEHPSRRLELGFYGLRHNDDYPKETRATEFAIFLTDRQMPKDAPDIDPYQHCVLRATEDYLEVLGRRIETKGPRLISDNGRFVTVQQNDGNVVTYDTAWGQEGDPEAAIWSSFTGFLKGPRE